MSKQTQKEKTGRDNESFVLNVKQEEEPKVEGEREKRRGWRALQPHKGKEIQCKKRWREKEV